MESDPDQTPKERGKKQPHFSCGGHKGKEKEKNQNNEEKITFIDSCRRASNRQGGGGGTICRAAEKGGGTKTDEVGKSDLILKEESATRNTFKWEI